VDSSVVWPHMLFGPYQCVYGALFEIRLIIRHLTLWEGTSKIILAFQVELRMKIVFSNNNSLRF